MFSLILGLFFFIYLAHCLRFTILFCLPHFLNGTEVVSRVKLFFLIALVWETYLLSYLLGFSLHRTEFSSCSCCLLLNCVVLFAVIVVIKVKIHFSFIITFQIKNVDARYTHRFNAGFFLKSC